MKKFRQLFLLLSLLLFAVGARAETITLNQGTSTNSNIPIYGLWVDSYTASQFIIPKGDIPVGCTISSMTFASSNESISWGDAQFVVYLGEVSDDAFSSAAIYDWGGLTQVYEGSLSISGNQMVVTFNQNYTYQGGNLLVGFKQTSPGTYVSSTWLGVGASGGAVSGYNSSGVDNITNYGVRNFLPQVTFEYTGGSIPCEKPTDLVVEDITSSSATVSWSSDAESWNLQYKASSDEEWTEVTDLSRPSYDLSNLPQKTTYSVRVQAVCDKDLTSGWASTTFTTLASCLVPTDVTVSDVTSTSATVTWESDAENWIFAYKASTDTEWTEESVSGRPTFELTGLSSPVIYTVRVKAVCSDTDESDWTTDTRFTTLASIPYEEPFATNNPSGWGRYSGLLADVLAGTATLATYSSGWFFGSQNSVFDSHARVNLYGTGCRYWLVAPTVAMEDNVQLSFDVALTAYSGAAAAAATNGTDDKFVVLISTNGGNTWSVLRQWDNAGSEYVLNDIATEGQTVTIDLSSYAGKNVTIAFYGESTAINADNNLHIDNVSIDYIPSCIMPTNLKVSDITITTAKLSWESDGDTWQMVFANDDNSFIDGTFKEVTTNPYTIEGLTPDTKYNVLIRTYCSKDDQSSWTKAITFTTPVACEMPTNVEVTSVEAREASISWEGTSDNYNVRYKKAEDEKWTTTQSADSESTSLSDLEPGTTYEFQVQGDCGTYQSKWTATYSFTTLESCVTPTDLAATTDATTATISWTGESDQYNIRYRESEGEVTLFSEDFENGLGENWTVIRNGEGTTYTDWRVINSETTFSSNSIPAHSGSFVVMSRSWNSNSYHVDNWLISPQVPLKGTLKFWVMDDGEYHEHYDVYVSTTNTELTSFNKIYEPGDASDTWTEVTVDLSRFNGQQGYIALRHTDYDQDWLFIDDFSICAVAESDAEWTEATATESPFVITGLNPETTYEYQVQGDCGQEQSRWSGSRLFTTLSSCPVPSDITVEPEATTANVAWEGSNDSYNLRYRKAADTEVLFTEGFESGLGSWTRVDYAINGNYATGVLQGIQHSGNYSFGFMYNSNPPQYLISPVMNGITDGVILEFYYRAYQSNFPESFQVGYSSTTNDVSEFTWGDEITTSLTSWQLFSEAMPAGTKYFCVKYNSNDQYYLFVDDFTVGKTIDAGEWTTIEDIEDTESEITGLESGTDYEVQVQGVCDESPTEWSESVPFTTLFDLVLLDNDLAEEVRNNDKLTEAMGKKANVTLSGRTFYKDGKWNSLFLPFDVTEEDLEDEDHPLYGATIKQLYSGSVTGTHVDMSFSSVSKIDAGWFYIFKWESGENIVNPVFKNVEIVHNASGLYGGYMDSDGCFYVLGNYNSYEFDPAYWEAYPYYLTSEGNLKYSDQIRVMKPFRMFFMFYANDPGALEFNLNFDDGDTQTGIVELDGDKRDNRAPEGMFNLQGMKYNSKPVQKGIYIENGRKVVVK